MNAPSACLEFLARVPCTKQLMDMSYRQDTACTDLSSTSRLQRPRPLWGIVPVPRPAHQRRPIAAVHLESGKFGCCSAFHPQEMQLQALQVLFFPPTHAFTSTVDLRTLAFQTHPSSLQMHSFPLEPPCQISQDPVLVHLVKVGASVAPLAPSRLPLARLNRSPVRSCTPFPAPSLARSLSGVSAEEVQLQFQRLWAPSTRGIERISSR